MILERDDGPAEPLHQATLMLAGFMPRELQRVIRERFPSRPGCVRIT